MTHRLGHIDGSEDGPSSMNRRKYLGALAAGAAFGAVAACGGGSSSSESDHTDSTAHLQSQARCITLKQWGYLSIFPPGILTVAEAQANMPVPGARMIRLPFFNSNGIEIREGMVVGFHVVRIGCPSIFAVAYNLVAQDPHPLEESERETLVRRNTNMDNILRGMGYTEVDWVAPDMEPCPKQSEDWSN